MHSRQLLQLLREASIIEESRVLGAIDHALTTQDATMAERLHRLGAREAAMQEGRLAFAADVREITEQAMGARDMRLLHAAMQFGDEGLRGLQLIGELNPPWMCWEQLPVPAAFQQLSVAFDQTKAARSHMLAQRLAAEVSARRGRHGGMRPPRALALAAVGGVLRASDVATLRAGGWVDVKPAAPLLLPTEAERLAVESDLRRHVRASGTASTSSCNERARTAALPLLGDGFPLSAPTLHLLSLLAALPAEIERHGWPRPLEVPPLVQLGCYEASTGARYSAHLDRNDWEAHNRREITILLYVNVGWDASTQGGCLRLHGQSQQSQEHQAPQPSQPPPQQEAFDIEPLAGRLVLFPSGTQYHEVLPCTRGERLALTLWVEHQQAHNRPTGSLGATASNA